LIPKHLESTELSVGALRAGRLLELRDDPRRLLEDGADERPQGGRDRRNGRGYRCPEAGGAVPLVHAVVGEGDAWKEQECSQGNPKRQEWDGRLADRQEPAGGHARGGQG